jgi:hypothetical protein
MMESENIIQLRHLIDELDKQDRLSDEYYKILNNIVRIINEEQTVICGLKGNENKIKHYESICKNILSIISSVKV